MHFNLLAMARGGAGGWLEGLLKGEPFAFLCLGVAVIVTGLICWLSFYLMKRRGQRLADGIGGCTFTFVPDGLFGRRFFHIAGRWKEIPFTLEAHKTDRKGDHRTVLRFAKPKNVPWSQIQGGLGDSRPFAQLAHEVAETSDEVALSYVGVGGDPEQIKAFLTEIAWAKAAALQVHVQ
jgi:hypothetical protein